MAIFIFIVNVTYSIVVAVQGAATESVAGWHRVRRRGGWGDPTVTQVSTWCRLSSLELFLFLTIEILTIADNCGQFRQLIQLLLTFGQLKRQSWRLATFETLITILTIENLNL